MEEKDPSTLEHYKRLWFLIITHDANIGDAEKKLNQMKQKQEERFIKLRAFNKLYSQYENQWLPLILNRLKEREELDEAEFIEKNYDKLKNKVFC